MTLYNELIQLFKILNLDIADVDYTDVYDYPNAVPFDIHFNNGYIIRWNLDREFYLMELRVITVHPRHKEGHIPSLILKGGMNNV